MVKNELEFRDLVASLLEKEGFSVQKEFKLPEGYRVDLLAIEDEARIGIEVKLNQRGISDDISKGSMLHKMPEFDYIYVAAPKMLISSEFLSYAKRLRIGVIGVKEDSIEWLQESEKLKPAQLIGGGGLPSKVRHPASIFEVSKHVRNHGEKIVRHLEMFFIPSGPFVTAPREKSRFKLAKLSPGESWEVKFKIKIKKSAKVGTYPLFLSCTADNLETSDDVWDIQITHEDRQEKFKWVKQDLLLLFGLLDFAEKEKDGFFSLPLSKENLIRNLIRITQKPKYIIEKELEDFEKNFDDYIEIREESYQYHTRCKIQNHPPSRSPCPTPEKSTVYYILKPELADASRNDLRNLDSEPEKIFNEVISKVQTVEDLIYISLLKYITDKCRLHDYYPFEPDVNSNLEQSNAEIDLKEIMDIANIDKEIIEYSTDYNSPFKLNYEKMNKFLPKDQKCFVIFYSHSFNTSSCYRINNTYIKKEIAQYIYEKLEEIHIHIIENMKKLYKELKQQIIANEERLPLFDYKDYRFKFMHRYYSRLKGIEKLYEFEIDDVDFKKALIFLEGKGIVEIKDDDEIILLSKDKFIALHDDLIERENQRINKNKKELLTRWLTSRASLELLETGAKDIKPKAPVYEAIEFGLEKKRSPGEDAYEVVLSFAGEDREYVEAVAEYLKNNNVKVFYDEDEEVKLWGKDLPEYLDKVYRGSAQYCVIFISKNYANKVWTRHEKQSALAKAIEEKKEYILPARFDDTEIPGIRPTIHYVDLSKKTPKQLGKMILQKLGRVI